MNVSYLSESNRYLILHAPGVPGRRRQCPFRCPCRGSFLRLDEPPIAPINVLKAAAAFNAHQWVVEWRGRGCRVVVFFFNVDAVTTASGKGRVILPQRREHRWAVGSRSTNGDVCCVRNKKRGARPHRIPLVKGKPRVSQDPVLFLHPRQNFLQKGQDALRRVPVRLDRIGPEIGNGKLGDHQRPTVQFVDLSESLGKDPLVRFRVPVDANGIDPRCGSMDSVHEGPEPLSERIDGGGTDQQNVVAVRVDAPLRHLVDQPRPSLDRGVDGNVGLGRAVRFVESQNHKGILGPNVVRVPIKGGGIVTPQHWNKIDPKGRRRIRIVARNPNAPPVGGYRERNAVRGDLAPRVDPARYQSPEFREVLDVASRSPLVAQRPAGSLFAASKHLSVRGPGTRCRTRQG
mmetsp:Transcript_19610/g.54738  ORF Transcript_19610/g.54738 Transcript_19610/m.54738 type:complete len:402 (-) Transcript_19610:1252-2457(-)